MSSSPSASLLPPSVVDTKVFGWFLENSCVWTIAGLRTLIPEPITLEEAEEKAGRPLTTAEKVKRILTNIVLSYMSSVSAEIGAVYALRLVDWAFFSHVPHFTAQRRSDSPFTWNAFRDWLLGTAWLEYFGGGIALGILESFWPKWLALEFKHTPFRPLGFLRNFAIFRLVVDITFYFGHRFLHVHPRIYDLIHRRHHEHYTTNLRTNWHFSSPDLFIESALPIGMGFATLRALGIKMGRFELHLMQQYIAWHESGTHLGKPLQIISQFAPGSILYHGFFPWLDTRAIEFHETHHNRRDCNYGITAWIDQLAGSAEFQKDILAAAEKERAKALIARAYN